VTDRSFWPIWRISWRFPIGWRAIAYASALLALAETPAAARDGEYRLDIPAGPVSASLTALSTATGISVGLAGELPQFQTRRLHGTFTAADALRRLLGDNGFRAVQVGGSAFRIEPLPPRRPSPPSRPAAPPPLAVLPDHDIVVTAQKRRQVLSEVPMSVSVITPGVQTPDGAAAGSNDVALAVDGFALTNLGPGRNRQFIRGVADSPFDGSSQATVAVQLDEARIIFDAPDPDLRLVDMARVEILKGPQGPLYGSGALGGIYHLITRKPELDKAEVSARLLTEVVQHGGAGAGGELVLNLPLASDRLALRAVAYGLHGGGWIDDRGHRPDSNESRLYGGRLALRWQPASDWTIDVGGVAQYLNVANSQYVTTAHDTLKRGPQIPEPTDNDFREVHATIDGRLGALRLVSATSYVRHNVNYTLDASAAAAQFGMVGQTRFRDDRGYSIINHELRLSPAETGRWLAGFSYLRAQSHEEAVVSDLAGAVLPVQTLDRVVTEYALFGEAVVPITSVLDATGGLRLYRTIAENEAHGVASGRAERIAKTALSPSLSLSWRRPGGSLIYLRYSRALRPGGLAADGQAGPHRFDSDELDTVDLGIRHAPSGGRLSFTASLYYSRWSHIQADYLLANGLVSTRNAGRGQIIGAEGSAEWRMSRSLHLDAGLSLQRARLTHTEQGVELDDRRLPIAPDVTARLALAHDVRLGDWAGTLAAQGNYIGHTRLALDDGLDRKMGNYATFSTSASFSRDRLTIAARIDNLLDIKGDSFAFGNPFSIMDGRQYTPLRPRSFTLSIARSW